MSETQRRSSVSREPLPNPRWAPLLRRLRGHLPAQMVIPRGPAGPPTVEARATDGASRPQDALCAVAVSAVRGGGPEFCDPGRRAARGGAGTEARPRNLGCRPASPGSSRSLATAQRKSGKLTFRKRSNPASRASAGGRHATRFDAREYSLASKDGSIEKRVGYAAT